VSAAPPWPIEGPELLTQVRWIVWRLEGGDRFGTRVTNAPTDRGRETIAGLTWRCYSEDYLRLPRGKRCPLAQFQQLTLDDVVQVMLEVFALRTNLWRIADPRLRLAVVDYAINAGADDAIPALQRAGGVYVDGIFGPGTEHAVNAGDPERLREHVMDERYRKAATEVLADQRQLANLLGWINRFGKVLKWRAAAAAVMLLIGVPVSAQDGFEPVTQRPVSSLGVTVPEPIGTEGAGAGLTCPATDLAAPRSALRAPAAISIARAVPR
jgi:lysozyme family protein